MRSDLRLAHVHRARRSLATAATCAGVALGIVVTTGVAAASPLSLPDAAASAISTPSFPAVQAVGSAPTLEGVVGAADAALTREQIGVGYAAGADGIAQRAGDVLLADHFREGLRPAFARQNLVAHRRCLSSQSSVTAGQHAARRECTSR